MQDTDSIIHIHSDFALSYEEALNRFNAELEDIPEEFHGDIDGFRYEGDHGEECYVSSKDAATIYMMNPDTGSVDTFDNWMGDKEKTKKNPDNEFSDAELDKQWKTLVEVVRINGD